MTDPTTVPATISKRGVLDLLEKLPDPIAIEELIYQLYLREKWVAAQEDIKAGRTLTAEEMRAEAASWRK